jgi:glycogen operon protein
MARTQGGNNNAWCQDNEISWFDWDLDDEQRELVAFARRLIALRRAHPVFRRRQFLRGVEEEGSGLPDAAWFRPNGRRMTEEDWRNGDGHALAMFLNGEAIVAPDERGRRVVDDSFVLLFNAHAEDVEFTLPPARFGAEWACELRTDDPECDTEERYQATAPFAVTGRSLVLLRRTG